MITGGLSAIFCGVLIPAIAIITGEVTNTFDPDNTKDETMDTMERLAGIISLVGLGTWIFGYMYYGFW